MEEKMKKNKTLIVLVILASFLALSLSGCYGSFALTKKVYKFNGSLGAEPVKTLVMWAFDIIPVYGFACFADVVIFNTLEFWTGSNPIAMNDTQQEIKYYTENGVNYKVVTSKNRYDIYDMNSSKNDVSFVYNTDAKSWSMVKDGQTTVITNESNTMVKFFDTNGHLVKAQPKM